MKKSLFFFAAAAIALTACTSENDILQIGQQEAVENQEVGFDVYVPQATNQTRAGRTNVMTTGTLQKTGFGLFGYQTNGEGTDKKYTSGDKPDFMWNQQVSYNKNSLGWYYAPLKYWPNETKNDSQDPGTTPNPAVMPTIATTAASRYLDRLTFFAYAPWVKAVESDGEAKIVNTYVEAAPATNFGITRITASTGEMASNGSKDDAQIRYFSALDPNKSVDLLWGVAPAGGLSYTNVSGGTTTIPEGMPLIDLTKPAVNTNMKFSFQHALARLGVKVVLAADQVAAGGVFDYGNTKVTIEEIKISGQFGTNGILNMNNGTAYVANWIKKNKADGTDTGNDPLIIDADHGLAAHLIYNSTKNGATKSQQEVTGVTTTIADAIQVSSTYDPNYQDDYVTKVTTPEYSPTTPYFESQDKVVPTGSPAVPEYATYAPVTTGDGNYKASSDSLYFHKFTTSGTYSSEAYTQITPNFTYPNATVWENIYSIAKTDFRDVSTIDEAKVYSNGNWDAYKVVGKTWTPTGKMPEIGDKVVLNTTGNGFVKSILKKTTSNYYVAKPNYFMVIPTNNVTGYSSDATYRTLNVKIKYYVSTVDENLNDNIVYTKNEVEKSILLPSFENGKAYNLKLILGLTSVKVEAEVSDWVTIDGVVNLPQNTNE